MLNLQKYVFISTDYGFVYDAGSDADFRKSHDPNFVKVYGFALDYNFNPVSCYFMEDFKLFNLSKDSLVKKLDEHPIFKGLGSIRGDKNYRNRINLDNYEFSGTYDFSDIVDFS